MRSFCGTQVLSLYRRFEREKQRKYEHCIKEVEWALEALALNTSTSKKTFWYLHPQNPAAATST